MKLLSWTVIASVVPAVVAAQPMQKPVLGAALAEKLVAACTAEASRQNIALSIVVLDDGGHVLLAKRMDGARFKTLEVATGKAQTALALGAPSAMLQEAVDKGKVSYLTVPGVTAIQGGLPIMLDSAIIGAMAASGAAEQTDEACVKTALDRVMPEKRP